MAVKKTANEFPQICADIQAGNFKPVYLLHGEEEYYTDHLLQLLLDHVLEEDEKDFNLMQFYGADSTLRDVINACRAYPMMGRYQLVVLREMQSMDMRSNNMDDLTTYLEHPMESTILVIVIKTKKADGKLRWVKRCKEVGVAYESAKVPEYGNQLQQVVKQHLKERGLKAEEQAIQALCDAIGNDLARMFSEIEKLRITLQGSKISLSDVLQHIGISREYNVWELQDAIATRNVGKVERIRRYFQANPKAGPVPPTLASLFNFFSNLMLAHYSPDKTVNGLMSSLGISFPQAKNLVPAMEIYNAWKTMNNIALLREYDARSKGARGGAAVADADLYQELFYKLMH